MPPSGIVHALHVKTTATVKNIEGLAKRPREEKQRSVGSCERERAGGGGAVVDVQLEP